MNTLPVVSEEINRRDDTASDYDRRKARRHDGAFDDGQATASRIQLVDETPNRKR